jgi:hypothetical protein
MVVSAVPDALQRVASSPSHPRASGSQMRVAQIGASSSLRRQTASSPQGALNSRPSTQVTRVLLEQRSSLAVQGSPSMG